jgi:hypothetical protein
MDDLYSEIDAAKKIATRLIKRNRDAATAERKRDVCFYKFLESAHNVHNRLRKMRATDARKALKQRYGPKLPTNKDPAMFAVKLAHPRLDIKIHSKYAAVLRLIRQRKRSDQSVRDFVRANGDIKGCVEEERKLRRAAASGHGVRKRQKK